MNIQITGGKISTGAEEGKALSPSPLLSMIISDSYPRISLSLNRSSSPTLVHPWQLHRSVHFNPLFKHEHLFKEHPDLHRHEIDDRRDLGTIGKSVQ